MERLKDDGDTFEMDVLRDGEPMVYFKDMGDVFAGGSTGEEVSGRVLDVLETSGDVRDVWRVNYKAGCCSNQCGKLQMRG